MSAAPQRDRSMAQSQIDVDIVMPATLKGTSGTNADVAVTLDADAARANVIAQVFWSYNGTPVGRLTIEDGSGTIVFDLDITNAGPGFFSFHKPRRFTLNTATIVKLYAGGSGVVGKLWVDGWTDK